MPSDPPQLDYAPPVERRRRIGRWIIAILMIALAVPLLVKWTINVFAIQRIHQLYNRCAAIQRDANTTVFDEAAPSRQQFVWDDFVLAASSSQIRSAGTLFVGELRTSAGTRWLVGVDVNQVSHVFGTELSVTTRGFESTPTLRVPQRRVQFDNTLMLVSDNKAGSLWLFAGQIDPMNPGHFTIAFAVGEKPGIIDGWIKDDGQVLLEVRP